MTGRVAAPKRSELPGRHVDETTAAGWLTRRTNPSGFFQGTLLLLLTVVLWPAAYGGRFAMVMVAGESMTPTYELGDTVITWREPVDVGDVILYRVPDGQLGERNAVIHRVVGGDNSGWITLGDNNPETDRWIPANRDIDGVAKVRIPLGGRGLAVIKSWLFISVVGGLAALLLLWPDRKDDKESEGRHRSRRLEETASQT